MTDDRAAYEQVMEDLRMMLGVSRTTLRLDRPDANYPVAAESCARVPSIRHDSSTDQRNAAMARWILKRTRSPWTMRSPRTPCRRRHRQRLDFGPS
jgi:hypothetical protein